MDRETALKQSPRVRIETPRISGSIALKGGRIDDVVLTDYHETVDPKSPNVILLSPAGAPDAYFAEFGWIARAARQGPRHELTLAGRSRQADAGAAGDIDLGQWRRADVSSRVFASIDRTTCSRSTQRVENSGTAPVTLYPYARVRRTGTPKTAGYTILHEGPIGIFNK